MKIYEKLSPRCWLPKPVLHAYLSAVVQLRAAKLVYITARVDDMSRTTAIACAAYQLFTNRIIDVSVTFKRKD